MPSNVFMTGFPGFIAKRLVDRLLRKDPEARFTFLIEERLRGLAESSVQALGERHPGFASRAKLFAGDIAQPWLGLPENAYRAEADSTTHVWHLAAIYNLAVPAAVAYRVNVVGTATVLDFCEACPNLNRLDYVSTCYVSGNRAGRILESELDEGQTFKNHYESTKCWAELEVRRRMMRLPVAIHRPGIVVGDSKTGETDKYDGPYFIMKLLTKIPSWIPMVNIGEGQALVNLVPVDFLVDAMAELWAKEEALGQTVHLADPHPHTAREVMQAILESLGFSKPLASVPPWLIDQALAVEPLRNLIQIPRESVIYFNHGAFYDTAHQQKLLQGSGVDCPDFLSILPVLARYIRKHPDKPFIDGRVF
jgi:thioester reductase-like protein